MIKINRKKPPQNTSLDKKIAEALDKVEKQIEDGETKYFKPLWSNPEVKEFLYEAQHGKCCFCERKRDLKRDSDVEHFRPKAKVSESSEHPGYWWLAYEWDNLFIACKTCNQGYKKDHFPLKDETKRAFSKNDNFENEEPYLINPLKEDPENFIEYEVPEEEEKQPFMIKAIGKCERGKQTIEKLTGINYRNVMIERAEKLKNYKDSIILVENRLKKREDLEKHKNASREFAGFARFYLKQKGY